jgi:hypothetical protein
MCLAIFRSFVATILVVESEVACPAKTLRVVRRDSSVLALVRLLKPVAHVVAVRAQVSSVNFANFMTSFALSQNVGAQLRRLFLVTTLP